MQFQLTSDFIKNIEQLVANKDSNKLRELLHELHFADIAELPQPEENEAVSFLPTLMGKTQTPLRKLWFFRRREGGTKYGGKTIEAVISGDWKLLQNTPFEPQELYNLKADPQEQNNLAQKNRKMFNELTAAQRRQLQKYGTVPWQKPAE